MGYPHDRFVDNVKMGLGIVTYAVIASSRLIRVGSCMRHAQRVCATASQGCSRESSFASSDADRPLCLLTARWLLHWACCCTQTVT